MFAPKARMLVLVGVLAGLLGSCNREKLYGTFKLKNGVSVVTCQSQIGPTCVLGLKYLRSLHDQTKDPIYFDRSYTIVYSTDVKGGQFEFQPFQHVDCSSGKEIQQHSPPQHNDQPFKTLPSPGNPTSTVDPSQFDADDGQCYKHVIKGKNGESDVDPHIIIGSGGP